MSVIKGLRKIAPYVAGSQPKEKDIIKLNTNENAYGPSPKVAKRLLILILIIYGNIQA